MIQWSWCGVTKASGARLSGARLSFCTGTRVEDPSSVALYRYVLFYGAAVLEVGALGTMVWCLRGVRPPIPLGARRASPPNLRICAALA